MSVISKLNNNQGSSVLENLIAFGVFTIAVSMICASIVVGSNMTSKARQNYNLRAETFNGLEGGDSTSSNTVANARISFSLGDVAIDNIEGLYQYNNDVGEFIKN